MFRCNHCHSEYGGIRGLSADSCPRCKGEQGQAERRDWSSRPFASAPVPQRADAAVSPLGLGRRAAN